MSAWIVTKAHVDVLVQALIAEGIIDLRAGDITGAMIWRENHKSINFRYGERNGTPGYLFEGIDGALDDAVVSKAISCYTYQACEHPGWEGSQAYELMEKLHAVINERHEVDATLEGIQHYWMTVDTQNIPWGIKNVRQAIA